MGPKCHPVSIFSVSWPSCRPSGSVLKYAHSRGGVLLPRWALGLQLCPVPHPGAQRHCAPVPELPLARWQIATVPLMGGLETIFPPCVSPLSFFFGPSSICIVFVYSQPGEETVGSYHILFFAVNDFRVCCVRGEACRGSALVGEKTKSAV